jgi:hypothetical protein
VCALGLLVCRFFAFFRIRVFDRHSNQVAPPQRETLARAEYGYFLRALKNRWGRGRPHGCCEKTRTQADNSHRINTGNGDLALNGSGAFSSAP